MCHRATKMGFHPFFLQPLKAEVMSCKDLLTLGSEAAVKEKGLLRIEGKEYVVQDGDCMHFRFNVTT